MVTTNHSGRQLRQTSSEIPCLQANPREDQSYAMSRAVVVSMNMLLTKVALQDKLYQYSGGSMPSIAHPDELT